MLSTIIIAAVTALPLLYVLALAFDDQSGIDLTGIIGAIGLFVALPVLLLLTL